MLYNILHQTINGNHSLNTEGYIESTVAIPADEGLADIAFQEGWRILVPAIKESLIAPSIMRREAWEWGIYLYDLIQGDGYMSTGDVHLMADDPRFSPFVEDCSDCEEDEEGLFDEEMMPQEEESTEEV